MLAVYALALAVSAARHSPVYDEGAHLAAGIVHAATARGDAFRVNPPLTRLIAAIPVVLQGYRGDWRRYTETGSVRTEFDVGYDFQAVNGERTFWLVTTARWACIPLQFIGALTCYLWASELYRTRWAGWLALVLWCSCPTMLGHGQLITADASATALGVLACYFYWRWLKRPSWGRSTWMGIGLGLALLTKSTWIVLFALWPALLIASWVIGAQSGVGHGAGSVAKLLLAFLIGCFVLHAGYGFEEPVTRLREFHFRTQALSGQVHEFPTTRHGNRFVRTWAGSLPIPLPRWFVEGIDLQKWDFERGQWSYLRGEWKLGGWWYYYLYAFAVKAPLGTLALLGLGVALCRRYALDWYDEFVVLAPAVVIFVLVSAETGFSHHLRYVLPAFPFQFIWVSKLARSIPLRHPRVAVCAATALCGTLASSAVTYPHGLSYFNELAGRSERGYYHLCNSNIDWGQDLLYLRKWYEATPAARPLHLAYFGLVDPRHAGLEYRLPPPGPPANAGASSAVLREFGPVPGSHAVSVNFLTGMYHYSFDGKGERAIVQPGAYTYFQRFQPVARAGYSIYIYRITLHEANSVRRDMGLPELPVEEEALPTAVRP